MTHPLRPIALAAALLSLAAPAAAQTKFEPSYGAVSAATFARPRRTVAPMSAFVMSPVLPQTFGPAPTALREVSVGAGVTRVTLGPAPASAAVPAALAATSTAHETLRVRVATRVAALVAAEVPVVLTDASGAVVRMRTTSGACGANAAVAILDAGEYLLRAPGTGPGSAAGVEFEAVPVGAGATVEGVGVASAQLNTAGDPGGANPATGDGVDARVLACPGASGATLRADRGAWITLESARTARAVYALGAGQTASAATPAGRLVVVRAFGLGAERGGASATFR